MLSPPHLTVEFKRLHRVTNAVDKRERSAIATALSQDLMLTEAVFSAVDTLAG
jgi:hypothetical protein